MVTLFMGGGGGAIVRSDPVSAFNGNSFNVVEGRIARESNGKDPRETIELKFEISGDGERRKEALPARDFYGEMRILCRILHRSLRHRQTPPECRYLHKFEKLCAAGVRYGLGASEFHLAASPRRGYTSEILRRTMPDVRRRSVPLRLPLM